MFAYYHDMLRFGAFYQKIALKLGDFRDLLLEGAIFIVGTQNLPQLFNKNVYDYQMFCDSMNVSDPCCE